MREHHDSDDHPVAPQGVAGHREVPLDSVDVQWHVHVAVHVAGAQNLLDGGQHRDDVVSGEQFAHAPAEVGASTARPWIAAE